MRTQRRGKRANIGDVDLDRALFLAFVTSLAACPSTAPKGVASKVEPGPKGFRPDAPPDPHPVDVEHDFPGPTKEALGVFRPDVGCGTPLYMGAKTTSSTPIASGVASYPKHGVDCFGTWACTGDDELGATPPDCAALPKCTLTDGDLGSIAAYQRQCSETARVLRPRIASRAMKCMVDLGEYFCQPGLPAACREHALLRACDDPAADASCVAIEKACQAVTRRECRAYLSGMTEAGRAHVARCMKDDCGGGLRACVDDVTWTADGN